MCGTAEYTNTSPLSLIKYGTPLIVCVFISLEGLGLCKRGCGQFLQLVLEGHEEHIVHGFVHHHKQVYIKENADDDYYHKEGITSLHCVSISPRF